MSFTETSNPLGNVQIKKETYDLPASGVGYSSVIDDLGPNANQNRYVTFVLDATAVSGTNLDIALYGADNENGTKVLLLDALVPDITDGSRVAGQVDLNAYPAGVYWVGWTVDVDESANDIALEIYAAKQDA